MAESQGNRSLSAHTAMWKATVNLEYFHRILSEQVWSCNSDFRGGDSGLQCSTDISGSLLRIILGKREKTRNQRLLELPAATRVSSSDLLLFLWSLNPCDIEPGITWPPSTASKSCCHRLPATWLTGSWCSSWVSGLSL